MPLYEHVFLARQDVTAQQVETMVETYKGVIEANGGKIEKIEMWGVKSLAYRIKKNRKAHFTLLNIDAPPAALSEMERQMQISEDVLRFMTVRVEQLESEPSAMMQKRDRDDRKDRERGRRRDDEGFGGGGGFGGDRDRGDRPERSFGGERAERPERSSFGGEA
ncbi:MAG TPA: 30S ribosomal protein S6 [Geminicoccaceae bacterium]|jgi:small subunit ribosomal protein S6